MSIRELFTYEVKCDRMCGAHVAFQSYTERASYITAEELKDKTGWFKQASANKFAASSLYYCPTCYDEVKMGIAPPRNHVNITTQETK